jgi:hypothetical protein
MDRRVVFNCPWNVLRVEWIGLVRHLRLLSQNTFYRHWGPMIAWTAGTGDAGVDLVSGTSYNQSSFHISGTCPWCRRNRYSLHGLYQGFQHFLRILGDIITRTSIILTCRFLLARATRHDINFTKIFTENPTRPLPVYRPYRAPRNTQQFGRPTSTPDHPKDRDLR